MEWKKVTMCYWLSYCIEDYEVLKRNFRNKSEEMETTTNKLKMQLKSAQSELEQTRNTLKSMEGSDCHGMLYKIFLFFFCFQFHWSRFIKT
jgi:hypothetical protein